MTDHDGPGGYLPAPTGLLSPSASIQSSQFTASSSLPRQRGKPLKSGGAKESSLIRFMDESIDRIQRRFANRNDEKFGANKDNFAVGYRNYPEVKQDIERLVDLAWTSGTPSLQVPYLLNLAMIAKTYLPEFPPAPKASFSLLNKLDLAFASLLQGHDLTTGETLPGFSTGRGISDTHKVRIKSLVDQTRLIVAEVLASDEPEDDEEGDDIEEDYDMETEDDFDDVERDSRDAFAEEDREVGIARVYEQTIVELGDMLGGTPIGIITDS